MDWNKLGHCRAFYLLLFFKEIAQLHSSMIKNYRLNLNLGVTMFNLNAAEEKKLYFSSPFGRFIKRFGKEDQKIPLVLSVGTLCYYYKK